MEKSLYPNCTSFTHLLEEVLISINVNEKKGLVKTSSNCLNY